MNQLSLDQIRRHLYAAVVCDVLDGLGFRHQSPRVPLTPYSLPAEGILAGRCRTTLWTDMAHEDPRPYELELEAVDRCRPDDILIAAAGGSLRSGIWGELLTTAARNGGCIGAIVDGAVRDVSKIHAMEFSLLARGTSVYDSQHRQRVVDIDVPVEVGGVVFEPGCLVVADLDGVVVVPRSVEAEALELAWKKVHDENVTRQAIQQGMKATDAYRKYGVL